MNWLRKIHGFVRILVAAFVVAQFAGVNSSPLANAEAGRGAVAWHVPHQHLQGAGQGLSNLHHGDRDKAPFTEHCCALHAFCVGIPCPAVGVKALARAGTRIALASDPTHRPLTIGRLDRPPRRLA